jgi:phage FluMu protein Com
MNHILQAIISTIFHCKRTCPTCKEEQVISPADLKKTIRCKFCGAEMPDSKDKEKQNESRWHD